METVDYKSLKLYERPEYYMGQTWYGWYPVLSQTRDSSALDRSNYRRVYEDLRKLDTELLAADIDPRNHGEDTEGDSTVCDTRVSHFLCGWAEVIYVHSSNKAACQAADEILNALSDYPVYDESDFSRLENEELEQYWEHCGMSERMDICKRAGGSFLQARHPLHKLDENIYQWYSDHYAA